jgi:hypothetical protein
MADMLGRAMSAVNLHRLGLQRGLTKLEAILGPKLDAFGYTKDTWGTVYQFLIHGAKYAFPTKLGQVTRGFPTAHAASPLKDELQADTDLPPVWPHKDGTVRGTSVEPLYKSATEAALADPALYELLALLDALRMGRARERQLAAQFLEERLK